MLVLYAIAGWIIIQVASTILPGLQVPSWSVTLVIVLVALGLPLAAILAWAFDIGNDGLKRTAVSAGSEAAARVAEPASAPELPATPSAAPRKVVGKRSSIAVLPFANLTGDAAKDYLGDGLAEELIHTLAGVSGLRVPSRTSSFAYRGRDIDLRRIAQELEVSTVLEGSVRAAGERIRITAQLIDGETGYHLWSQHYDRRFEDLFELQDELASAIILQTVSVAVQGFDEHNALRAPPTRSLEAYQLYLAAAADIRTAFRGRQAFEKLQAALRIDPGFGKAQTLLVLVRSVALVFGIALPGTMADAEQDALRALDSAPDSATTHAALGLIRAVQARWADAEASFQRSLALDPAEPETWARHAAVLLGSTGHLRAQLSSTLEAIRLAPAEPVFNMQLAVARAVLGDDIDARKQVQAAIDLGMSRTSSPLADVLAQLEVRAGRHDAACALIQESRAGMPRSSRDAEAAERVFDVLAGSGDRSAAMTALAALRTDTGQPQFMRRRLILWYSMLGAYDEAFEVMHGSLDDFAASGTIGAVWGFLWMSEMRGFRADPQFNILVSRMKLPDYWEVYGPPDGHDWRDGRLVAR